MALLEIRPTTSYDTTRLVCRVSFADVESSDVAHEITCAPDDLHEVRAALEEKFGVAEEVALTWKPQSTVPVGEDKVQQLFKLLEALEDNDDVQTVSANFDVDDIVMATLTA